MKQDLENFNLLFTIDHRVSVYFDLLFFLFHEVMIMVFLFLFPIHYVIVSLMISFNFLILTEHFYILNFTNAYFVHHLA